MKKISALLFTTIIFLMPAFVAAETMCTRPAGIETCTTPTNWSDAASVTSFCSCFKHNAPIACNAMNIGSLCSSLPSILSGLTIAVHSGTIAMQCNKQAKLCITDAPNCTTQAIAFVNHENDQACKLANPA